MDRSHEKSGEAGGGVIDERFVREHAEPPDSLRTPFVLDRHRIIGCTAFRRLEGKTQVFAPSHHDHFRTRLTHTLEAAHIARILARGLGADEDLAEAITLAHDLGHPPFGHAGEKALGEVMASSGGFNHNLHALRVVEFLEHPYPGFRGLNLTAALRAGLASHATKYDVPEGGKKATPPSVEAQISSLADRAAYCCHDLEDAIGAGFVGARDLRELALWREACRHVGVDVDDKRIHAVRRPVLDGMVDLILRDVIAESGTGSGGAGGNSAFGLSENKDGLVGEVEGFLADRVFGHPVVAKSDAEGRAKIVALFEAYCADPARMPVRFAARVGEQGTERVVCDYIAGMTDRYCEAAYAQSVTN